MSGTGDCSSSFDAASGSRELKCLFCGQALVRLPNRDREDINKLKRNDSSRKRKNQADTRGGEVDRVLSKETLIGGMEIMRKTLEVESAFPGEDVRNSVAVEEVCCNKCFATLENLVKVQEQIDTLEASKLELVQLLQTLISKSQTWKRPQLGTSTESWTLFSRFRKDVSKHLPKPQTTLVKIERETSPPPADQSTICENIFVQSSENDSNSEVGESFNVSTISVDMRPVVKLERTDLALFTDGNSYLKHNASCEDEDSDNEGGFLPPDSPIINYDDDTPQSDDSYQPEEPRKKKRIVSRNRGKKLTAVGCKYKVKRKRGRPKRVQPSSPENTTDRVERTDIITLSSSLNNAQSDDDNSDNVGELSSPNSPVINYDDAPESDDSYQPEEQRKRIRNIIIRGRLTAAGYKAKRKRGRPKQVKPSSAENTTEDPPIKRGRGRPRTKGAVDGCSDARVKRKRGRPSKISLVTPAINKTNELTDDPSQSASEAEDDSHPQQHSREEKIVEDTSKKWKEDGSAFYPVYALNPSEGEYMFLNVKFKITPTSFLCQHPHCSDEVRFVGHFTEQIAFLMQRLHIRKQHRVGFRNRYKYISDADALKYYYCCCHCQLQLESMSELTEHCKEHHDGTPSPLAVCEVCGDTTAEEDLIEHIITHKSAAEKNALEELGPGRLKQASRPLIFPCDECDKLFDNTTLLRTHRVKHVPVEQRRQHICDLCGELFLSPHTLKSHIATVHFKDQQDRPYECPYCAKTFLKLQKMNYEQHVLIHSNEKPFQCEQCGKAFGTQRSYKIHMGTHVYKPIPCQYCGQMYKTKNSLRVHHMKHHPELQDWSNGKPVKTRIKCYGPVLMHPCEPCGHLYRYKSALVAHMKNKHKMELQRNEDYPTMWTWEDDRGSGWSK